jgi:hypothetical protein
MRCSLDRVGVALLALGLAGVAEAAQREVRTDHPDGSYRLELSAEPQSLAADANFVVGGGSGDYLTGQSEIYVTVFNPTDRQQRGVVRASSDFAKQGTRSVGSFDVGPRSNVVVRLPVHTLENAEVAVESDGTAIYGRTFHHSPEQALRVFDAHATPRLRAVLENVPMSLVTPVPGPYGPGGPAPPSGGLRIRVVAAMKSSGNMLPQSVLPQWVASWHGIDAVFISTADLVALDERELSALGGFVIGGGTLALSVTRPDDLRHPSVVKLVGGEAHPTSPDPILRERFPEPFLPTPELARFAGATVPGESTVLQGYSGGNLAPVVYGSAAPYGLGQVALLSFDLDNPLHADDPFVGVRLLELTRSAHERRASGASGVGTIPRAALGRFSGSPSLAELLQASTSKRWTMVVVCLLLCVYGAFVGPGLQHMGKKRGDLLFSLRWLPVASLSAFLLVVAIGIVTRGFSGRARRISFVETGAGMDLGVGFRARGFFTPSDTEVLVGALREGNALSAPRSVEYRPTLEVKGDALTLGGFESLPSQTVVVREEGLLDLGGPVDVYQEANGTLIVHNRTPTELRSVLLKSDKGDWFFTASIPAGERWSAVTGTDTPAALTTWGSGSRGYADFPFEDFTFHRIFGDPSVGETWAAIDGNDGRGNEWFPADVPVLLATVDEDIARDSGFAVEKATTYVRVVGFGVGR